MTVKISEKQMKEYSTGCECKTCTFLDRIIDKGFELEINEKKNNI